MSISIGSNLLTASSYLINSSSANLSYQNTSNQDTTTSNDSTQNLESKLETYAKVNGISVDDLLKQIEAAVQNLHGQQATGVNGQGSQPPAMPGPGPNQQGGPQGSGNGGPLNDIAKVLGIDTQTLNKDLQSGQSIADVAKSQGIDEKTLISDLQTQVKSKFDQDVQNGKLTQDQEQQMLSDFSSRAQSFVEQKGPIQAYKNSQSQLSSSGFDRLLHDKGIMINQGI